MADVAENSGDGGTDATKGLAGVKSKPDVRLSKSQVVSLGIMFTVLPCLYALYKIYSAKRRVKPGLLMFLTGEW
jgi:hypothetical protein